LAFWVDIEAFKAIENRDLLLRKAVELYVKYIGKGSEYELNIPDSVKSKLKERLKQPSAESFDDVQKSILQLMGEDLFPKFLKSERYLKLTGLLLSQS
jgi:hypothetical protein